MLVQFMFRNVLSFKGETVLDMSAVNAYKEHQENTIDIGTKEKFLKVAAIYGANASGKSNIYYAMSHFHGILKESLNSVGENEITAIDKYYNPFAFDDEKENSEYQIILIIDEHEYKYGFEFNEESIIAEWLYRNNLKNNRQSIIFERERNNMNLGASVRSECDAYKTQIPSDTLLLSFFNKLKLKNDVFNKVYTGIMDTLVVSTDFYENTKFLKTYLKETIVKEKEKLIEFLSAIDTGIVDITYDDSEKEVRYTTWHLGKEGKKYPLNMFMESEGTIKSIILFIVIRVAIINNKSLFVDELNIKLHPLLLKFIIDLFYNEDSMAQLIYTTHDTTLMDKKFFRRDQIWFVEKDQFGYSTLTALSDYKVRQDASFEKDYLAGVYGGIPFFKEFEMKEGK